MKKYLLFIFISLILVPTIVSCADEDEKNIFNPCKPSDLLFCGAEVTGEVQYDSLRATSVIYVDSVQARQLLRDWSPAQVGGLILAPGHGKFFNDGRPNPSLAVGDSVRARIKYIDISDTIDAYTEVPRHPFVSVVFDEIEHATRLSPPRCGYNDNYPVVISRSFGEESVYPKKVCLAIHILRNSDGTGGGNAEELKTMTQTYLAKSFANTAISFEIVSVDYINYFTSSLKKNFSFDKPSTHTPIFNLNSSKNMIHIYFRDSDGFTDEDVAGVSQDIPGYGAIFDIKLTKLFESTLGHEIGHCLGLYHTFRGTSRYVSEKYGLSSKGESGVPELVNGSNSAVAGDFMTDTPADPNVGWGQWGYNGKDIYKDANGDSYNPDPKNIMSYSWNKSYFSAEQMKMMHYTLRTYMPQVQAKVQISGPQHFAQTASYTYGAGSGMRWRVVTYSEPTVEDTTPPSVENSYTTQNLTLTCSGSHLFEIKLEESSTGVIMGSELATAGPPSPICGSLMWKTSQYGVWEGSTTNMDWGETLYISGTKTVYLGYEDKAGASLTNVGYRTVTAANRVLNGSTISITPADCAQGFLKFRLSDSCGQGYGYFTIPVSVIGGYYAVDVNDNGELIFMGKLVG